MIYTRAFLIERPKEKITSFEKDHNFWIELKTAGMTDKANSMKKLLNKELWGNLTSRTQQISPAGRIMQSKIHTDT